MSTLYALSQSLIKDQKTITHTYTAPTGARAFRADLDHGSGGEAKGIQTGTDVPIRCKGAHFYACARRHITERTHTLLRHARPLPLHYMYSEAGTDRLRPVILATRLTSPGRGRRRYVLSLEDANLKEKLLQKNSFPSGEIVVQ